MDIARAKIMEMIKKLYYFLCFLHKRFMGVILSWVPINIKWRMSLVNYVDWANKPLPREYLDEVIKIGGMFSKYVGNPQKCLDIGCGNGMFGGQTYEEVGYSYLSKTLGSHTTGLDPLPLITSMHPWLDEYKRGVAEEIPFSDNEFDKIVIATSLDHVKDPVKCLCECYRVLRADGVLYIWTSYRDNIDRHHPVKYGEAELFHLLRSNGFKIIGYNKVTHNQIFLKASLSTRAH